MEIKKFIRDRWEDIRGHLIWQILVWIFGGGLVAAIVQAVRSVRQLPFEWWFVGVVFLISALALAVVTLLAGRKPMSQQSPIQTTPVLPVQPAINLSAAEFFRTAYYSNLTVEVEKNIRLAAAQDQPNDREGFLAKFIGVGVVMYAHDQTWAYIYKSQLFMLTELNQKGGIMPLPAAKLYYDKAADECPEVYANYSFEAWMEFMKGQQLIIQHPSAMLEITVRGKDFLKYLTHWGRLANARKC